MLFLNHLCYSIGAPCYFGSSSPSVIRAAISNHPGGTKIICGIAAFVGASCDIKFFLGVAIAPYLGGTKSLFGLENFVGASHDIEYVIRAAIATDTGEGGRVFLVW